MRSNGIVGMETWQSVFEKIFRYFNLQIIIKETLSCTVLIVRRSGAGVLQKVLLILICCCVFCLFPQQVYCAFHCYVSNFVFCFFVAVATFQSVFEKCFGALTLQIIIKEALSRTVLIVRRCGAGVL